MGLALSEKSLQALLEGRLNLIARCSINHSGLLEGWPVLNQSPNGIGFQRKIFTGASTVERLLNLIARCSINHSELLEGWPNLLPRRVTKLIVHCSINHSAFPEGWPNLMPKQLSGASRRVLKQSADRIRDLNGSDPTDLTSIRIRSDGSVGSMNSIRIRRVKPTGSVGSAGWVRSADLLWTRKDRIQVKANPDPIRVRPDMKSGSDHGLTDAVWNL